MERAPKWYLPLAIVALLWNGLGCAGYLSDVMLTPADVAKLSALQGLVLLVAVLLVMLGRKAVTRGWSD
jgi:hypothetical protein